MRRGYDVQVLIDRQEIVDVLIDYAIALDTKDWELLATTFAVDAEVDYGDLGPRRTGCAAICADLRALVEPLRRCSHMIDHQRIDIDGDRAAARTHLIVRYALDGATGGSSMHVGLVFHDELRRTGGGWRISARRVQRLWTVGNPGLLDQARARTGATA